MDYKICMITGTNAGMGLETAKILCAKGATTVLVCRSEEKAIKVGRQPKIMAKQIRRERKTALGSYNFGLAREPFRFMNKATIKPSNPEQSVLKRSCCLPCCSF